MYGRTACPHCRPAGDLASLPLGGATVLPSQCQWEQWEWRLLSIYYALCPGHAHFALVFSIGTSSRGGGGDHPCPPPWPRRWNTIVYRPTGRPVASQPGGVGGSELGWVEHQAHPPPLGHLKNAPTLGHSQAPPPLDIARVTSSIWKTPPLLDIHKHPPLWSSTYSKGGTKLLKGGTKLLKGGTKSLGWATGGVVRPPRPPPPPGYGPGPTGYGWPVYIMAVYIKAYFHL